MGKCSSNCLIPKKFCCSWPLKTGAVVVGTFMFCLMVALTIAMIVQVFIVKDCDNCDTKDQWRSAFSMNIVGVIYAFFMALVHLWLLWGIKKDKGTVVLAWLVLTAVWIGQSIALLVVLLSMYGKEAHVVAWWASLFFAMVALGLLLYGYLVVYAYFKELVKTHNPFGPNP